MTVPIDQTDPPTIRFGLQVNPKPDEIESVAAEAEAAGFDVITVADHVGANSLAPLTVLARMAAATTTIQLGTMVVNNDMRNPVQLAWEAVTLSRLSRGRFELGIGAGHTPHEYAETGIDLDRPAVRKRRLAEAVEIIGALTRAETVDHDGEHYRVSGAVVCEEPETVPILVGGNGTALLTHAARHAEAIGLQGLGRTLEDGHRHTVKFSTDHLDAQLETIAAAAGDRRPELGALVQVAEITDDRDQVLATVMERIDDLALEDADATPYLAVGTEDELVEQFIAARDRWGISYFTTRSMDLGPVAAKVRDRDAGPAS